jgi:hypothetical protein
MLGMLPTLTRSRADVLGYAATLAVDDALQAAVLLPELKALPYLISSAFDEVFAVRIVDGVIAPYAAPVPLYGTQNRRFDL